MSSTHGKRMLFLLRCSEEIEGHCPLLVQISEMAQGLRRTRAHHDFHGEPVSQLSIPTDMKTCRKQMRFRDKIYKRLDVEIQDIDCRA
jgi:hypothetical protein